MAFNPNAPRSAAYPGQRPANDPILNEIIKASVSFWNSRGINVAGTPVDVADDITEPGQAAFIGGRGFDKKTYGENRFVLDSNYVGSRLKKIRSKRLSPQERREQIMILGALVAHELGHVGGLQHTKSGLMSGLDPKNAPYEVKQLAAHLIRNKKKKARRSGPVSGGGEDF